MSGSIEKNIENKGKSNLTLLEEIYSQNKSLVFNLCCRYFSDRAEAEDACHDIFLKIFKNLDSFREESKISTWIYRLTINHCLNCIRRKKILNWLSLDISSADDDKRKGLPEDSINIESEYMLKEKTELLNHALEKLPEKQKTALLLHRYEELPYSEIAKIMDCSISSVESLIFRAKQNLTKQLLKYNK